MKKIEIPKLLDRYIGWVNDGKIQFLKTKASRKKILQYITELKTAVENAEKKGDRSRNLNWYEAHKIGRKLWEELASAALNDIDPNSKGNDKLFGFLDKATEFEDLLYGLDDRYRDHTLHSLWVYFIGEYILRERLPKLRGNLNWYLYNDIEAYEERYSYPTELVEFAQNKKTELGNKVNEKRDAVWCIIALCHDLGYSLARLKDLNKKVKDVVAFFDISHIKETGYFLNVEHKHLAEQFLELMAMEVRIAPNPNEDYKDLEDLKTKLDKKEINKTEYKKILKEKLEEKIVIKCYRDDSTYWRLCRAFEKKEHGILSAYLIYKMLGIFANTSVRGPAEDWGLEDEEVEDNIIRGNILFAIAQHSFDFAHLYELNSLGDILVLADELEEFSRYGRQMLAREYHDTMAWSDIKIDVGEKYEKRKVKKGGGTEERDETKTQVNIIISYEVAPEHDLIEFFTWKAKTLCMFYSLEPREYKKMYEPVFYKIKGIEMSASQGKYALKLDFKKGSVHQVRIKVKEKRHFKEVRKYNIECHDGKLTSKSNKDKSLVDLLQSRFTIRDGKIIKLKGTNK